MGVKERRERQKESLREEIIEAARDLFVRDGYENVSMRRVAEKIEYSPTTIYLYFKDKADLLESICRETFAQLIVRLEKIFGKPGDPVECLKRGMRAYIEFGLENPHHYRVTFMTRPPEQHDYEKLVQEDYPGIRAFNMLRRAVSDCVQAGKFRVRDVEGASQALWASAHGLTSLLISHEVFPWVSREKLIHLVVDSMVAGMEGKKNFRRT